MRGKVDETGKRQGPGEDSRGLVPGKVCTEGGCHCSPKQNVLPPTSLQSFWLFPVKELAALPRAAVAV